MKRIMSNDEIIDLNKVTLEDCVDLYEKKDMYTVLSNGKVIDFNKEEIKEI